MRNILRRGEGAFSIDATDETEHMAIRYGFSREWVLYFKHLLGEEAEAFMQATFDPAPMTLRAIKGGREALIGQLESEGFKLSHSKVTSGAVIVKNPKALFKSEAYREGLFYVQDAASQQVVECFSPYPEAQALDLCAAPGGKSFQMAEKFRHVQAYDLAPERLKVMERNRKRLGYENITMAVRDGKTPLPEREYDRILVDAPCSGLGLLRRKPEIKLRITLEEVRRLAKTQRLLLEQASKRLAKDGELVYSTCTVTVEENEGVLASFLKDHPEFQLRERGLRYWPHRSGCDGFSMAVLVRKDHHALDGNATE